MGFKKTKLKTATATDITQAYFATKKRNSRVFLIATLLSSMLVGAIGYMILAGVSSLSLSFKLPTIITRNIPFLQVNTEPEKLNILLTGIGGAGHEGSDLTDTIMLASINRRTKSVTMISLPRDLYVEFKIGPQTGRGKLNELYNRALFKKMSPAESMKILADKVTEITGEPIDRFLQVDFAGFTEFVDTLGGIDVDVPESIVDREYPDNNWGYQTFRISKGFQTLPGSVALKYVRSRHSTSDFDRSARQQLVIGAIKDKLISLDALTSPTKITGLYNSIVKHIHTDMPASELVDLALYSRSIDRANILAYNINDGCYQGAAFCGAGGFLYTPERELFGGAAVLLPDTATARNISEYSNIRRFVGLMCNTPEIGLDKREIVIVNSTRETRLGLKVATKLQKYGFRIPAKDAVIGSKEPTLSRTEYLDIAQDPTLGIAGSDPTLVALEGFVSAPKTATGSITATKFVGAQIGIIL